jgi:hypothetical protein
MNKFYNQVRLFYVFPATPLGTSGELNYEPIDFLSFIENKDYIINEIWQFLSITNKYLYSGAPFNEYNFKIELMIW